MRFGSSPPSFNADVVTVAVEPAWSALNTGSTTPCDDTNAVGKT